MFLNPDMFVSRHFYGAGLRFFETMKKYRLFVIILAFLLLSGCTVPDNNPVSEDCFQLKNHKLPLKLDNIVLIESISLSDCSFPEDGSFENKEDVLTLEIRNIGTEMLKLVRVFITTDKNEYLFEITTLPCEAEMLVFEKNGSRASADEEVLSIRLENTVFFENGASLQDDLFEISEFDKVMNVRNITKDRDFSDVYVYFKKLDADGKYFGGITFRARVSSLKAGELKQISVPDFSTDDSEVVFVEYVQI